MTHTHNDSEEHRIREKTLDETLAGTFPASDPLSSLPNPDDDSLAAVSISNDVRPLSLRTPEGKAQPASQPDAERRVDAGPFDGEARITVHRQSPEDVGFREIFVSIDGKQVAILRPNETFTVATTPGPHRLRVDNTLFWKTRDLVLRPGEHASFEAIIRTGFGTFAFMAFLGTSPLYLTFQRDE